ncbi:hypothetical protein I79_004621 [Cricetulus griseus]|uniref:Uncharacterized protein n=1 Tax=Cricetulus griseus TaxID=10029 RepID=G3H315_CRIGR|nr:hypothetical protein I79_004621 [Cricetulus griseus]
MHTSGQLRFSSHEFSPLGTSFRSSPGQRGLTDILDLKAPPPELGWQALHRDGHPPASVG